MITIDKKTCAACQRCEFLNSRNNCGILNKPIGCAIYPVVISNGKIYVDMACPAWEEAVKQWDEQFGHHIDDYDDGRDDHKFVDLWIAHHQI